MYRNVPPKVMPPRIPGAPSTAWRFPALSGGRPIPYCVLCLALILPGPLFADFSQSDWSGGASTAAATDSTDQTGWTLFDSRDPDLLIVNDGGDLVIAGEPDAVEHTADDDFALDITRVTHTTDADFNTGSPGDNLVITGGSVRLAPGQTGGAYESAVIDLGPHLALTGVELDFQRPAGTRIVRREDDADTTFPTIGVRGSDDGETFTQYLEYSNGFVPAELFLSRYIQYQFWLETADPSVTPSMDEVSFVIRNYPAGAANLGGTLGSSGTPVEVVCSAGSEPCDAQVQLADGFNSGVYLSSIIDLGTPRRLSTIDFDAVTPAGTSATVSVRAGSLDNPNTSAGAAAWTDWQAVADSGDDIAVSGMYRYVQYGVELTRTASATPVLERVRVNYLGDPTAGDEATLISSAVDSEAADNRVTAVQWTEALPDGSDVRLEIATAATEAGLDSATFFGPDGAGTYWNSANTHDGGCFRPADSATVACLTIPDALRDATDDRWIAYRITLVASGDPDPESPTVSDVIVRYRAGAAEGVTVAPVSGLATTEAGGTAVFGVALQSAPVEPVVIDLGVDKADEIALSADVLTFTGADWNVPQLVTVTGQDDAVNDDNQLVTIGSAVRAGSDAGYTTVDIPDVTVTNIDDDALTATVAVTDANATEAGPTDGEFTISLNGPAPADLPVNFNLAGTATGGTDYFVSPQSPATIPAGQDSVTITVTPIDDTDAEGDESVEITLAGGAGYVLENDARAATLFIIDDEPVDLPTVSVTRGNADPNEAIGLTGFFTISRAGPTGVDLAVMYTISGTATPGIDYDDLGNSVVIPAGQTNIVLPVSPVDDNEEEGNETVVLTVDPDANYLLAAGNAGATITIIDDDTAPQPTVPGGADSGADDDSSGLGSVGPFSGLLLMVMLCLRAAVRRRAAVPV